MKTVSRRFLTSACVLLSAFTACREPGELEGGLDDFDGAGSTDQAVGGTCSENAVCTMTGNGAVYTATYRIGCTPTSRGELVQTLTSTLTGTPGAVVLSLRHLRAFTVPATAEGGAPAQAPQLHVGVFAVSGPAPDDTQGFLFTGDLDLNTFDPSGRTVLTTFGPTIAIPIEATDPAQHTVTSGARYGVSIWTDNLPTGATGSLLLGVGALVDADGTVYTGGAAFRRSERRASSSGSWGPTRLRDAGSQQVALSMLVGDGTPLAIVPDAVTVNPGHTVDFAATGGFGPYTFRLLAPDAHSSTTSTRPDPWVQPQCG